MRGLDARKNRITRELELSPDKFKVFGEMLEAADKIDGYFVLDGVNRPVCQRSAVCGSREIVDGLMLRSAAPKVSADGLIKWIALKTEHEILVPNLIANPFSYLGCGVVISKLPPLERTDQSQPIAHAIGLQRQVAVLRSAKTQLLAHGFIFCGDAGDHIVRTAMLRQGNLYARRCSLRRLQENEAVFVTNDHCDVRFRIYDLRQTV